MNPVSSMFCRFDRGLVNHRAKNLDLTFFGVGKSGMG
jgi:hypothetical protein